MKNDMQNFNQKPRVLILGVSILISGGLLLSSFMLAANNPIFCTSTTGTNPNTTNTSDDSITKSHLNTILHYATSRVTPQQTIAEIKVSFDVLLSRSPCNFLVFGLGHDSQMWHSFNPRGTTLFLEEDPRWVQLILKHAPFLHALTVYYKTKLSEAEKLLDSYRTEPNCYKKMFLRGNKRCRLALDKLSPEVYDKEWDLIMIDAPRGYFPDAPGRMAAIYSAAVMARNRKGLGVTDVVLHDVDRKVEKAFAEEFLCRKYLVKSEGRLWHFQIPAANATTSSTGFC